MLAVLAFSTAACTDYLSSGTVDLTMPEQEFQYPESYTFSHPCGLVTSSQITRIKQHVAAADESDPVYACWLQLCDNVYAQSAYTPSPLEHVVRGATSDGVSENYIQCDRDAAAAFQLALRWLISDDSAFADAAVRILNAWASTCTSIEAGDSNMYLLAGFQGYQFAAAAELLRSYSGWSADSQATFKSWLLNIWYSANYYFINTHGGDGNCNLHYWTNWEFGNLASILAIGIYTENVDMVNFVYQNFREGAGSGCINNYVPYDPVADPDGNSVWIAQNMESGRDQGHATLDTTVGAELCQMAWSLGIDFWGMENNKFLAAAEYTAKYNVAPSGTFLYNNLPFTTYYYCPEGCGCSSGHSATHTEIASDSRGTERPCWDLVLMHYAKETDLAENYYYYTKLFAEQLRSYNGELTGDCGGGFSRFGANSSAFDQLGWSTLLFYQE